MTPMHQHDIESVALDFINHSHQNIFLTGGAGTGKTTFLKFLKRHTHKKMVITAPTGVAAVNAGGVTIHSLFGLPPRTLDRTTLEGIRLSGQSKSLLRDMELLVIDEASMLRADVLDGMDYILQEVRQDLGSMGGLQTVFIGDLYQLPPIESQQDDQILRQKYKNLYFTSATVFPGLSMLRIELTRVYRQADPAFIELLNGLRIGHLSEGTLSKLNERYMPDWSEKDAIVLTTHNRDAASLNNNQLETLQTAPRTFQAEVTGDFPVDCYPVDDVLMLKVGCRVMVVKNDSSPDRLFFNGKTGIVSDLEENAVTVNFDDGLVISFNRETWSNVNYKLDEERGSMQEYVVGSFKQFPLKLAWAITVHKSQGLTFERAIIDIARAFAPGQVYVALSRVKTLEGVFLRSKIPSTAIITARFDENIFQEGFDAQDLISKLATSKKAYMSALLRKCFNWDNLYFAISDSSTPGQVFETVRAASWKLQGFASKFLAEIESIVQNTNWRLLSERLEQADGYFSHSIDETCIGPLRDFIKKNKGDIKYRGDVNRSKNCTRLFKDKIVAIKMASLVAQNISSGVVYQPDSVALTKTQRPASENQSSVPSDSANLKTEAQTLQMFLEGKSIADIAVSRSLGLPAIEAHLASYIPSGQVALVDIIPQAVLDEIYPLVIQNKHSSLAQLYSLVGNRLSMGQLKALSIHLSTNL